MLQSGWGGIHGRTLPVRGQDDDRRESQTIVIDCTCTYRPHSAAHGFRTGYAVDDLAGWGRVVPHPHAAAAEQAARRAEQQEHARHAVAEPRRYQLVRASFRSRSATQRVRLAFGRVGARGGGDRGGSARGGAVEEARRHGPRRPRRDAALHALADEVDRRVAQQPGLGFRVS